MLLLIFEMKEEILTVNRAFFPEYDSLKTYGLLVEKRKSVPPVNHTCKKILANNYI